MKKASMQFLLSLIIAALILYGMALFSYKLTQPFFKEASYNEDVKRLENLLYNNIDSTSVSFNFPSNSKKTLLLAYDGCSVLNEIKEKYDNIPSEGKFYFCFYDEDYNNLKCGYYNDKEVKLESRIKTASGSSYVDVPPKDFFRDYKDGDPCFLLPRSEGSIYVFSLSHEKNNENDNIVLSVSKSK